MLFREYTGIREYTEYTGTPPYGPHKVRYGPTGLNKVRYGPTGLVTGIPVCSGYSLYSRYTRYSLYSGYSLYSRYSVCYPVFPCIPGITRYSRVFRVFRVFRVAQRAVLPVARVMGVVYGGGYPPGHAPWACPGGYTTPVPHPQHPGYVQNGCRSAPERASGLNGLAGRGWPRVPGAMWPRGSCIFGRSGPVPRAAPSGSGATVG